MYKETNKKRISDKEWINFTDISSRKTKKNIFVGKFQEDLHCLG